MPPTREGSGVQKVYSTSLCLNMCLCESGATCRRRWYVCENCAFMSLTIFKNTFGFTVLIWILLIYPHISSHSTYWSFRHLWACGCLINSLLVLSDYLYPVSPFFFKKKRITRLAVRMVPNLIIHLQPLCPISASLVWLFLPISPHRTTSGLSHWEDMCGQADKTEDWGGKKCGLLASGQALTNSLALKTYGNLFQQLKRRAEESGFP